MHYSDDKCLSLHFLSFILITVALFSETLYHSALTSLFQREKDY